MKQKMLLYTWLVSLCIAPSSTLAQESKQGVVCELQALEKELYQENNTEQIVLENFTPVIQHFFTLLQNAHDPQAVAQDMSSILAQIVNISLAIVNNLPNTVSDENRLAFIDVIAQTLKAKLTLVDKARSCLLSC
jgi:hypothetical protein